jgi:hypothetical protein
MIQESPYHTTIITADLDTTLSETNFLPKFLAGSGTSFKAFEDGVSFLVIANKTRLRV